MFTNTSKLLLAFVFALILVFSIVSDAREKVKLQGYYLGQKAPAMNPIIFAQGIVSTPSAIEFAPAFSSDGTELYFTRVSPSDLTSKILMMNFRNGRWSEPVTAPFSEKHRNGEPFMSHDGKRLFFSSDRPVSSDGEPVKGDIWYVDRKDDGWSEPVPLGTAVNTIAREGHPSLTIDDTLYFHRSDETSYDIYCAKLVNGKYRSVEKLGPQINTESYIEGEPAISPNGSFILFVSAGRNDRIAADENLCDIYISFRNSDDSWTEAKTLGSNVLSSAEENWPYITPDGKYIFFSSNRNAVPPFPDIYWVDAKIIDNLKVKK